MTLGSSEDTVAILYDNENAPYEMLEFALKKARHFLPCRMIVIADWDKCPEQKRWHKLMSRPGFTFRQIERTREGENSLDYALADNAQMMCREGVARFVFITNDADFADIAKALRKLNPNVFLVGVGGELANYTLRKAYDKFICYKPRVVKAKTDKTALAEKAVGASERKIESDKVEEMGRYNSYDEGVQDDEPKLQTNVPQQSAELVLAKGTTKRRSTGRVARTTTRTAARVSRTTKTSSRTAAKSTRATRNAEPAAVNQAVAAPAEIKPDVPKAGIGELSVRIPKTLHQQLLSRMTEENVDMSQLVTYILMQGINK